MKRYVLAVVLALALLVPADSLLNKHTAQAGSAVVPGGEGLAFAFLTCIESHGFERQAPPAFKVVPSTTNSGLATIIDYDTVVLQSINRITMCTFDYFEALNFACQCRAFDNDIALYAAELDRLFAWYVVPVFNVNWDGGTMQETIMVGSTRYNDVIRWGMLPAGSFVQTVLFIVNAESGQYGAR